MRVRMRSNILRPTVSVFCAGTGLTLGHNSLFSVKCRSCIIPIQNMSLKSSCTSSVSNIGRIIPFVPVGVLQIRAHIGVVDILAVPVLNGTMCIDSLVEGIFLMELHIISIQSHQVTFISECTPTLELAGYIFDSLGL